MFVTKVLARLRPLYGKDNVEIVTLHGIRVRGVVVSLGSPQAFTPPVAQIETEGGEKVEIPFPLIQSVIDHNQGSHTR